MHCCIPSVSDLLLMELCFGRTGQVDPLLGGPGIHLLPEIGFAVVGIGEQQQAHFLSAGEFAQEGTQQDIPALAVLPLEYLHWSTRGLTPAPTGNSILALTGSTTVQCSSVIVCSNRRQSGMILPGI